MAHRETHATAGKGGCKNCGNCTRGGCGTLTDLFDHEAAPIATAAQSDRQADTGRPAALLAAE